MPGRSRTSCPLSSPSCVYCTYAKPMGVLTSQISPIFALCDLTQLHPNRRIRHPVLTLVAPVRLEPPRCCHLWAQAAWPVQASSHHLLPSSPRRSILSPVADHPPAALEIFGGNRGSDQEI